MSHSDNNNPTAGYIPPFASLFQGDMVPSPSALQSLIADIDGQLDQNTRELDKCLQSILTSANNLPGSRTFSIPRDALGYVCSSHTLEKDTCYDPESEEAVAIIVALIDSLEKNPGSEESILQEILALASEEGLTLPLKNSLAGISQSSSSLNVQLDSMDQLIEGKWSKLSHAVQKHLVSELLKLPQLSKNRRTAWAIIERRSELVGGLRSLASDDEAWVMYRNVRGQQLEQLFNSLLPDNDSENVNYKEFCCNCGTVADRLIDMIEEDFTVLCTGVFKKIGGVYRILHDLYLEKYSDEMSLLVEEIADDIRDFNKKVVKASKSDHGLSKTDTGSGKGHSKSGPRGSLGATDSWASKTPLNSQSLDTMFLASSFRTDKDKSGTPRLQKQSSMAFPKDCISSLRHIAMSLMKLEDFLDGLTKMTSWDVTGLPNRKSKKKSSLRGVLKTSASPELKRHSLNLGSSFSSSDTPYDLAHPTGQTTPPFEHTPAPKVIERSRSEDKVKWDWRLIFKKIASGLASAVEAKIDHTMSTTLTHETSTWHGKHLLDTVTLDFAQYGEGMDHPRVVSKDTHDFIQAIDELLPLARAGIEGCLIPVRTAFIDSLGIAVKNFHLHCVTLSKDVPHKATVRSVLVIVSNAVYVKNYLLHVETILSTEDNGKKFMTSLLKQYTDLIDGLGKHILQLHNQMLATSVFSDADSGNWAEIKEFQEDERCSFTVQMWNFYLQGIQQDMWQTLPPRLAQNFFSSVLQDSLLLMMQRYARVRPSFRRFKQMRYDITSILLCSIEHLLKACSSISQYLDPGHNQLPHYSIHNQCSNLLAVMAVVTSPIDTLYRVFKRGYSRRTESQDSGSSSQYGNNTQWLHWMWPSLIHSGTKHYDDMQTTSALYLHLRIFLGQPQMDWGGLTQALFMKDYTLSILLLTRACQQEESRASLLAKTLKSKSSSDNSNSSNAPVTSKLIPQLSNQSSTDSNSPMDPSPSFLQTGIVLNDNDQPTDIQMVVDALVHILGQVHYFPDALAKCIIPVIDRCTSWEMFNIKNPLVTPEMKVPEWVTSVFKILEPFSDRVIEPMLRYLNRVKTSETFIRPVISYVADLPCGCPPGYSLRDHSKPPGLKDVLSHCLELLITEIEKCVIVLPASVCTLFSMIETNCRDLGIKTSHRCVALQVITWSIWTSLQQFSANVDGLGDLMSSDTRKQIMTVADSLFHVLVYGKGPNTPKFALKFIKSHKDWLTEKINSIASYISDEFHSLPNTDFTEAATNIFTDHVYSLLASSIMDSPNGFKYLDTVSRLVVNNSHWLLEQLDVQPPVPLAATSQRPSSAFKMDISEPVPSDDFNPIKAMMSIGDSPFNQMAIQEFPFDWMAILTSDLGLSQPAFRSLLMNRHEMQEGATLEEAEKKPVDVLRAVYEH
ncbi:uncharacterized protein KIAA0825 [Aplysia californica]|uniref:Uncharacterized protein KIAA0825 n=1 Tax=Aplysia californica TaxID=6500 RepID=A0ABM0JA49_APLCA|nr:uncharacterized protein KIAA0825 [Aplysia californica]